MGPLHEPKNRRISRCLFVYLASLGPTLCTRDGRARRRGDSLRGGCKISDTKGRAYLKLGTEKRDSQDRTAIALLLILLDSLQARAKSGGKSLGRWGTPKGTAAPARKQSAEAASKHTSYSLCPTPVRRAGTEIKKQREKKNKMTLTAISHLPLCHCRLRGRYHVLVETAVVRRMMTPSLWVPEVPLRQNKK